MLDEDFDREQRKMEYYPLPNGVLKDYLINFKKEGELNTDLLLIC